MLSLFFAGKFSQTQLGLTLTVVNLLGKEMGREEIPTSFNGCAKVLLAACGENIEYTKEFFCVICDVMLIKPVDTKKKEGVINEKLLRIRPPGYIQCYPRPLYTWNLWSCHEYLSFILFYALIVFKDIMTQQYYENLINLVIPLEILLSSSIRRDALNTVDSMLNDFVNQLSKLYGEDIMVSGFHELLHLVECTKQFGPFNSTNCFQFEELNRKVVQLIKGKSLIGEEFYKLFVVAQSLIAFVNNIQFSNPLIAKFIAQYSIIKSSNKKKDVENNIQNIIVSCKIQYLKNPVFSNLINDYNNSNITDIPTIKRFYHNNILYTDETNESKFCDHFIKDKSTNNYGSIVAIIYE